MPKYVSTVYVMAVKVGSLVMSQKNGEIDTYIGNFIQSPSPMLELVFDDFVYSSE